jgi:uncharacterized protein with FMN-binding domain
MKTPSIRAYFPVLAIGAAAAAPAANALAAHSSSAKTLSFKGPTVQMRFGTVQVTIGVKSKKITKVSVSSSLDSARSDFLAGQAVPVLKQETLSAQSAKINEVSGATDLSAAYAQSLQSAIKQAQKHKALK